MKREVRVSGCKGERKTLTAHERSIKNSSIFGDGNSKAGKHCSFFIDKRACYHLYVLRRTNMSNADFPVQLLCSWTSITFRFELRRRNDAAPSRSFY